MSCGRQLKIIVISLSTFVFSSAAQAADMTNTEIYAKCHARLSDHPVDIDSADYKNVEAGKLDPVKACEKILTRTTFVKSGSRKLLKNQKDQIAISTLRNLTSFHQSWFTSLGEMQGSTGGALFNFIDHSEPALFITDALFGGLHYKTIFTRKSSIRGFRKGEASPNYVVNKTNYTNIQLFTGPLDRTDSQARPGNVEVPKFKRVSLGYLVGIEPTPNMNLRERDNLYRDKITTPLLPSTVDDTKRINLAANFGGGILGSAAYLSFNAEARSRLDGGVRVHRRMANNTFYDLMCLTLPTLNNSDISAYMNKYKSSKLSFRKDKSCAQCHASLDPFANVARNVMTASTASNQFRTDLRKESGFERALEMSYMKRYKVRTNTQSTEDVDRVYHRRAPKGELHYRNYNGKRVFQKVNNLADLGNKIAAQEDIYMCAAQRYYHFLTGVNVSVAHQVNDSFYKKHRAQIIAMGKRLKSHGSLKKLIVEILKSDAFKTRAPNLELVAEKGGE